MRVKAEGGERRVAPRGKRTRRKWSVTKKVRIVQEVEQTGAAVSEVARRHGVHVSMVTRWRAQYRGGQLGTHGPERGGARLMPVRVRRDGPASLQSVEPAPAVSAAEPGAIEVQLTGGAAHVDSRDGGCRDTAHGARGVVAVMMGLPAGVRIWLAAGFTDLRKGFDGLSALVQTALDHNPYSGQIFVFRGRRGDRIKVLWDSQGGLCLFYKRLRGGKFVWPLAQSGTVSLSAAQLSMLLEGIDWQQQKRTALAPQDQDRVPPTRAT
jgi:transposase